MKKILLGFLSISCVILSSCGGHTESDIVAINPKTFTYNFSLNPSCMADSTFKNIKATVYLYSQLTSSTQFTLQLEGMPPNKTYQANIRAIDSLGFNNLSTTPNINFPAILALDSIESRSTGILQINLDSFVNYYKGYLTITLPDSTTLSDSNLLIKGKIGN